MPGPVDHPGVPIAEIAGGGHAIVGVPTSITAFVGHAAMGPIDEATTVLSHADFVHEYGGLDVTFPMGYAVRDFFLNGGGQAVIIRLDGTDYEAATSILDSVDLINVVCAPGDSVSTEAYQKLLTFCVRRRAFLIVDSSSSWTRQSVTSDPAGAVATLGLTGPAARNAAVFYPRLLGALPACGAIAGVMARTDARRGVWKAPAGVDATLDSAGLADNLTDAENGQLNRVGINALRTLPGIGSVVWGARTLRGADQLGDEYKYIPVRRTALFVEESLWRGLRWAAFEPNSETLWASIRLSVGAFLDGLYRQGAFQGHTSTTAYFVKCDSETTTQDDIDAGVVNVFVGFAAMRPAEFIVLRLQMAAGSV